MDEKENITVRIEESGQQKPEGAGPTHDGTAGESAGTKVVFIRNEQELSAYYYRGFHDGCHEFSMAVLLLSMAVTFLAFMLVKRAAE